MHAESVRTLATLCTIYSPPGSSGHGILQAGVGCHILLQGIFPTQGLNPGLMSPVSAGGFFTTNTTLILNVQKNCFFYTCNSYTFIRPLLIYTWNYYYSLGEKISSVVKWVTFEGKKKPTIRNPVNFPFCPHNERISSSLSRIEIKFGLNTITQMCVLVAQLCLFLCNPID